MELLLVSKTPSAIATLDATLRSGGHLLHHAWAAPDIARVLREHPIDVVLVDAAPSAEGERLRLLIRRLRERCRVVFLASDARGASAGWLLRPDDFAELLADGPTRRTDDPRPKVESLIQALGVVVSVLESDDPYFAGGSHRVVELSQRIGQRLGLAPDTLEEAAIAALLRDVGKVALGPYLFESSETFGPEQAARMKDHVTWGERLLAHIDFPWRVKEIVRHHHERYDGQGFPDRLAGRQIPVAARIVAAADAWVAMTSDRRHRPARSLQEARGEILCGIGSQFDPEVVEALLAVVREDAPPGGSDRPTVVVVDRDTAYRRVLRLRLLDAGANVVLRENLDDVSAFASGRPAGAFVVDLASAGVLGIEALRLTGSAPGARPPLIALIAQEDRALRQACARHGVEEVVAKTTDLDQVVGRILAVLERAGTRDDSEGPPPSDGVTGRLEAMSVVDIVQFLSLGQKTAQVSLCRADGASAEFWLDHGALVHATSGDLASEEAIYEIVTWTRGDFRIRHGIAAPARTVEGDTLYLLMEGLRRHDEAARPAGSPL